MGPDGRLITDIAIQNPTNTEIVFPKENTAVIGVNEIMLDPDAMGEEMEEMGMNATSTATNMTSSGSRRMIYKLGMNITNSVWQVKRRELMTINFHFFT